MENTTSKSMCGTIKMDNVNLKGDLSLPNANFVISFALKTKFPSTLPSY